MQKHGGEVDVLHFLYKLYHNVSNIVLDTDVLKLDDSLAGMDSDQMVPKVNML